MSTLVKTSVLNGVAVLTRVLTAVSINKVLAIYVGPTGYALIGQFQSFVSMVATLANGAIGTGVTKYTAEFQAQPERQLVVWRTATMMSLTGSAFFALAILCACYPLASWLLGDRQYAGVFAWLSFSLVLLVLNGLLLAALNGRKAIGALVSANIAGSLAGAAAAVMLVVRFGLYGALVAQTLSQAVAFLFSAWFFRRACAVPWRAMFGRVDPAMVRSLGGFALMTLTSTIVVPLSLMIIRQRLGAQLGWRDAGLWQAMWKISDLHLMLLTNTLVAYFLPRFSEVETGAPLRMEVMRGYRYVVPLVMATSLTLFVLRPYLVPLLLSKSFLPINDVLGWQLLGDVLKIGSWVAGYALISRARARTFIALEVIFSSVLTASIVGGAWIDGLRGAAIGYAFTYALYWVTVHWACVPLFRVSQAEPLAA